MARIVKSSGFTLAEILTGIVVLSMTTAILMAMLGQMLDFAEEERIQNEIEREVTLFLDYLERDIKSAAGLVVDYPAGSPSSQVLALKIPEFEESGLPKSPMTYHYVVYTYSYESGETTRTVFADEDGVVQLSTMKIDNGPCYLVAMADWQPIDYVTNPEDVDNIEIAVLRYENNKNRFYWRSFVMESLMRNQL